MSTVQIGADELAALRAKAEALDALRDIAADELLVSVEVFGHGTASEGWIIYSSGGPKLGHGRSLAAALAASRGGKGAG